MKWLLVVLVVIIPLAASKYFGYQEYKRGSSSEDSCNDLKEECAINQGIQGQCLRNCRAYERAVDGGDLCDSNGCKCCTRKTDNCDMIYPGSYCGPSPCDRRKIEISDAVLCNDNHVCCRAPYQSGTHPELRHEAGAKGMKAHYITFDGLRFTFGGLCTYLLLRQNTTDTSDFHVWASHARVSDARGKTRVMVKKVHIDYKDHFVELGEGNIEVLMDEINILQNIEQHGETYKNNDMLFSWVNNQNRIRVEVEKKFSVEWNGKGHLIIDLHDLMMGSPKTGGKVVGVLGNANGVRNDDLIERRIVNDTHEISTKLMGYIEPAYEVITQLRGFGKPKVEDLIKVGISWMKNCIEV